MKMMIIVPSGECWTGGIRLPVLHVDMSETTLGIIPNWKNA